jgi:hypothetical protein
MEQTKDYGSVSHPFIKTRRHANHCLKSYQKKIRRRTDGRLRGLVWRIWGMYGYCSRVDSK